MSLRNEHGLNPRPGPIARAVVRRFPSAVVARPGGFFRGR